VSTAIADDTYFLPIKGNSYSHSHFFKYLTTLFLARRDADGGVILDPRNFTTKNAKKGSVDSVLFSKPGYVS
jgi:hypothetical protein